MEISRFMKVSQAEGTHNLHHNRILRTFSFNPLKPNDLKSVVPHS